MPVNADEFQKSRSTSVLASGFCWRSPTSAPSDWSMGRAGLRPQALCSLPAHPGATAHYTVTGFPCYSLDFPLPEKNPLLKAWTIPKCFCKSQVHQRQNQVGKTKDNWKGCALGITCLLGNIEEAHAQLCSWELMSHTDFLPCSHRPNSWVPWSPLLSLAGRVRKAEASYPAQLISYLPQPCELCGTHIRRGNRIPMTPMTPT